MRAVPPKSVPSREAWWANDPSAWIRSETRISRPSLTPELRLHLVTSTCPLWNVREDELLEMGLPDPYWAFAWPGGQAIARHVLDHPELVAGRTVLDLGSGSGIAAIAAGMRGATVVAADIDPLASIAAEMNAELNGVSIEARRDDLLELGAECGAYDVILAADVLYDDELAARVSRFLDARAASSLILLGDPGRGRVPARLELIAEYDAPDDVDPGDGAIRRRTCVYRYRAP
ncbi:MAG: methyltransferase [Deltaproteobacteria bacterium]|nr:methyltransferase [Deltaproteobacteria bacterium]